MEIIEVDSTKYAVYIHQRNEKLPYLLMLHGFMGDHRAFDHLIDELSPKCNPIAVDLLGHGQSSPFTNPDRYKESCQTDDIAKFITKLGIDPVLLYGYSMGGRLALKTAVRYPKLLSGLILEGTTNGILEENKRKKRQQIDRKRAQRIEAGYADFLAQWEKADLFQSPQSVDQSLKEKYQQIHLDQTPACMAASLRGFGTGFMTPETKQITNFNNPVLLMAGSADSKYQLINRYLVKQFPHATFASIEAGHRVHLDNPAKLIKEIKSFMYGRTA
jgi:2-succinyl-6-hydroxy-2,4-cyclohexadiene-1-carboxylate synthase